MKWLKIQILLLLCLWGCAQCMGQARAGRATVDLNVYSGRLADAKGWHLNSITGKWMSSGNTIPEDIEPDNYLSSFNALLMASFSYQGQRYYVIHYVRTGGVYEHPEIRNGWTAYDQQEWILMDLGEYSRLVQAVEGYDATPTIVRYAGGVTDSLTDAGLGYDLARVMATSHGSPAMSRTMAVSCQVVNGVHTVHFNLGSRADDLSPKATPLSANYFECSVNAFKALLMPLSEFDFAKGDSLVKLRNIQIAAAERTARKKAAQDSIASRIERDEERRIADMKAYNDRALHESLSRKVSKDPLVITGASDTLRPLACRWMSGTAPPEQRFVRMNTLGLSYSGQKKYALYYMLPLDRMSTREGVFIILQPAQYKQLKDALAAVKGEDVSISSSITATSYSSYAGTKVLGDMLGDANYSTASLCLTINVSGDTVRFRLPIAACPDKPLNSDTRYYECSRADFARILTLP